MILIKNENELNEFLEKYKNYFLVRQWLLIRKSCKNNRFFLFSKYLFENYKNYLQLIGDDDDYIFEKIDFNKENFLKIIEKEKNIFLKKRFIFNKKYEEILENEEILINLDFDFEEKQAKIEKILNNKNNLNLKENLKDKEIYYLNYEGNKSINFINKNIEKDFLEFCNEKRDPDFWKVKKIEKNQENFKKMIDTNCSFWIFYNENDIKNRNKSLKIYEVFENKNR